MPTYYKANWTVTNGIAFNASEALTWGGGASAGTLIAVVDSGSTKTISFYHNSGPAPAITDVIDGDITNAQRTIASWAPTSSNDFLRATVLPALGTNGIIGFECKIDISHTSALTFFRSVFIYLESLIPSGAGILFQTPNNYMPNMPNDFQGTAFLPIVAGLGALWSIQGPENQVGCRLRTDTAGFPRWGRFFANVDGLGVSYPTLRTRSDTASVTTIRVRARMTGVVTDPPGMISKTLAGAWQPLVGDFATWRLELAIDGGPFKEISIAYVDKTYLLALRSTQPITFRPEFVTDYPSTSDLSSSPIDYRYSEIKLFGTDGRTYEMTAWKIVPDSETPDPNHGWSVQSETGKVAALCGATSVYFDNILNRYLFSGLTYENAMTNATLPPQGLAARAVGTVTFDGPDWGATIAAFPSVQQEHIRGFIVMRPDSDVGVRATHVALESGTYRFAGAFARANDALDNGDGVGVSVVSAGNTLHSGAISSHHVVDPTSAATVFAGTGVSNFDITVTLRVGDVTRFIVTSGGASDRTFDATAFKLDVSYIPLDTSFTGWGGHRGTAGVDRAVRCPRCGGVVRETELVTDGVTRTPVCTRYGCYDPSPQPPNFRWPFRG